MIQFFCFWLLLSFCTQVFVLKFLTEWADVKELRIRDQYIEEMCVVHFYFCELFRNKIYSHGNIFSFLTLIYLFFSINRCRFGGGSLHPVAAALGGWGAHELIKLITAQYVPLNNALVYNGLTQNTLTLTLGDWSFWHICAWARLTLWFSWQNFMIHITRSNYELLSSSKSLNQCCSNLYLTINKSAISPIWESTLQRNLLNQRSH